MKDISIAVYKIYQLRLARLLEMEAPGLTDKLCNLHFFNYFPFYTTL